MRNYNYVRQIVKEFYESEDQIRVLPIPTGSYSTTNSGCSSYRSAISKLGYPIAVRLLNGDIYLIKVRNSNWTLDCGLKICSSCINRWPSYKCSTCEDACNYVKKGTNET